MKNVETLKNNEVINENLFKDFYIIPNLKFDISKLRSDLDKILKLKKFNSLGIKNFAAIPLNQIPGDKSSIEGHNVRGTYWTIPDETGKEAKRDKPIEEKKYTESYLKTNPKGVAIAWVVVAVIISVYRYLTI